MNSSAHRHPSQDRRKQPRDRAGVKLVATIWGILTLAAAGAALLQPTESLLQSPPVHALATGAPASVAPAGVAPASVAPRVAAPGP